ncbi:Haloacid dehalogenase-like hydrolase [anaerobic digester metagenome]
MDLFLSGLPKAGLHTSVISALNHFKQKGFRQIVLSAMQQDELRRVVALHDIEGYFEEIFGIDDHYAHGKTGIAKKAMQQCGFLPEQTCILGDTLHDAEIADYLGIDCILIAQGHQSSERLAASGYRVIQSLGEIHHYL